jgi:hypothetical protein
MITVEKVQSLKEDRCRKLLRMSNVHKFTSIFLKELINITIYFIETE